MEPGLNGDGLEFEDFDENEKKRKVRFDANFHRYIKTITDSIFFNGFIMFTIGLNSLEMALETNEDLKYRWRDAFFYMDETFLAIYTVEFLMKLYAEPIGYWKSSFDLFDFVVLVLSYIQVILDSSGTSGLEGLRVLRALRTLRTLRTISFVRGLQVLVIALISTIRKSVINIVILLFIMMFLFAIMGYYFFGYREESDLENWGNITVALKSLFTYVTLDGWTDIQDKLDELGMDGGRVFSFAFIMLGHFIFFNIFIAVIIMNISDATENYKNEQRAERETVLRHKKEFMMQRQHNDVKQMMQRQKVGHFTNFQDMVQDFQSSLRHDDYVMMNDLCGNLIWMEMFVTSLDHMDNTMYRLQQLHYESANILGAVLDQRLRKRYGT
ncbi:cation channel sperm-associated protein 3-like [Tubulanus polymorphus]|uniref:cation channel sperm-associated protein 3-like n=1 Tax=Tubulanus polymorphus TaxID=672921 RepID=UPI003DA2C1F3